MLAALRRYVATVEPLRLVAAMSTRPSPLKSAAATELVLPTLSAASAAPPPPAWRSRTLTVPLLKFCVATSGKPSPLKSEATP